VAAVPRWEPQTVNITWEPETVNRKEKSLEALKTGGRGFERAVLGLWNALETQNR
jgi:hypothetical protein